MINATFPSIKRDLCNSHYTRNINHTLFMEMFLFGKCPWVCVLFIFSPSSQSLLVKNDFSFHEILRGKRKNASQKGLYFMGESELISIWGRMCLTKKRQTLNEEFIRILFDQKCIVSNDDLMLLLWKAILKKSLCRET